MTKIFFISDHHFSHANILTFHTSYNTAMRNFSSVEEMDEHMIEQWNAVVKPTDHIYHLGDFAFKRSGGFHDVCLRLNGHKRLVLGNHDKFKMQDYLRHF